MSCSSVVVVVPVLNEVGTIAEVISGIFAQSDVPTLAVVIVDGGSTDGTKAVVESLLDTFDSRLRLIGGSNAHELRYAYRLGLNEACRLTPDRIVLMDADVSHSPALLPRLLAAAEASDLVIGSRYVAGGTVDRAVPARRRLLSRSANSLIRRRFSIRTSDATSCFRVMTLRVATLALAQIPESANGFLFNALTTVLCEHHGLASTEVPIHFSARQAGHSKLSTSSVFSSFGGVVKYRRPLPKGSFPAEHAGHPDRAT